MFLLQFEVIVKEINFLVGTPASLSLFPESGENSEASISTVHSGPLVIFFQPIVYANQKLVSSTTIPLGEHNLAGSL